jgi:hypothetical protein
VRHDYGMSRLPSGPFSSSRAGKLEARRLIVFGLSYDDAGYSSSLDSPRNPRCAKCYQMWPVRRPIILPTNVDRRHRLDLI